MYYLKSNYITLWYQFVIENQKLTIRCEKLFPNISENEITIGIKEIIQRQF